MWHIIIVIKIECVLLSTRFLFTAATLEAPSEKEVADVTEAKKE